MTATAPSADELAELRRLQEELEFTAIQEAYVKDELLSLQRELVRAKEEVKRIQAVPLVVGQFLELIVRRTPCGVSGAVLTRRLLRRLSGPCRRRAALRPHFWTNFAAHNGQLRTRRARTRRTRSTRSCRCVARTRA